MRNVLKTALCIAMLSQVACTNAPESSVELSNAKEVARIEAKARARAQHPNDPAAQTEAINRGVVQLFQQTTGSELTSRQQAAYLFHTYFAKHAVGFPIACMDQGVRLEHYQAKFEAANRATHDVAVKAFTEPGMFDVLQERAPEAAKKELIKSAQMDKATVKETCTLLETHASEMAEHSKFSVIVPEVHASLTAKD